MFHRRYVFLIGLRAWDVLTNPKSIGSGTSPIGRLATEGSEYMSFQDDYMFLGTPAHRDRRHAGRLEDQRRRSAQHEGHQPHLGTPEPRRQERRPVHHPDRQPAGHRGRSVALSGLVHRRPSGRARQQAAGGRHGHPQQPGDRGLHQVADRRHVLGQHRARDRERRELHRPPRGRAAARRASGACGWAW